MVTPTTRKWAIGFELQFDIEILLDGTAHNLILVMLLKLMPARLGIFGVKIILRASFFGFANRGGFDCVPSNARSLREGVLASQQLRCTRIKQQLKLVSEGRR